MAIAAIDSVHTKHQPHAPLVPCSVLTARLSYLLLEVLNNSRRVQWATHWTRFTIYIMYTYVSGHAHFTRAISCKHTPFWASARSELIAYNSTHLFFLKSINHKVNSPKKYEMSFQKKDSWHLCHLQQPWHAGNSLMVTHRKTWMTNLWVSWLQPFHLKHL